MRHFENAGKLRHEPPVEIVLSGVSVGGLVLTRRQSRKESRARDAAARPHRVPAPLRLGA